ncbi:MAG: GTP 3',8-cyclase MoaA [Eubacteriales bacterium]|nr:GTP 3',8-cyclase MoaA [Eubacteriales bacterium]
MRDQFGREIDYMRISVTDRCNLRCRYCMPEDFKWNEEKRILTYEEILRICRQAVSLGIHHYKITGGEPLVRPGITGFLKKLHRVPGVETVTLTTNGVLIEEALPGLLDAGIDGVNISLDTTDPEKYHSLTGKDCQKEVVDSNYACADRGIATKVNCVLLKDNKNEILSLAELAEKIPVDVRFIELMPLGVGTAEEGISRKEAREILIEKYPDLTLCKNVPRHMYGNGPAHYETSEHLIGKIGWIDAVSHGFCDQCNRIRLTSAGMLKPCLCFGESTDLKTLLREGCEDLKLQKVMKDAINHKPRKHCFGMRDEITEKHSMAEIGG